MLEQVRTHPGVGFDPEGYLADFWSYYHRINTVFWKLERIQDFREPGNPSWVAMAKGDWDDALRLLDGGHADIRTQEKLADGFARKRVRIVEHPVTPYLQWEMYTLRLRHGTEDEIRIVPAEAVSHLEIGRPLPEIVVLGSEALYEILYDETGTLNGARRIDDHDLVIQCGNEIADLFSNGEDLLTYFDREIAPMPPPRAAI